MIKVIFTSVVATKQPIKIVIPKHIRDYYGIKNKSTVKLILHRINNNSVNRVIMWKSRIYYGGYVVIPKMLSDLLKIKKGTYITAEIIKVIND